MKQLLIAFLVLISMTSIAQPIINRSSSANTISDSRLQAGLNLYVPRYLDTLSSLSQKGIDSTGAIIYTYTPNGFWVRKASPKRWVRISDADVTTTYAAGFGLFLATTTFNVDSTLLSTRLRLYKAIDSSIATNRQGLSSVLTVDDDADGKSMYNVSSLYTLDTLNANGVFELGYGAYRMSFPRTFTANRTMVVPDANDTLAGRTWVRGVLAGFTPTTPNLQAITDAGATTTNTIVLNTPNGDDALKVYDTDNSQIVAVISAAPSFILLDGANSKQTELYLDHILRRASFSDVYTYTFPNATGTIALTSDITGLDLQAVTDAGASTSNQISITNGTNSVVLIYNDSDNGAIDLRGPTGSYTSLSAPNSTGSRNLYLPNATGILATEDYVTAAIAGATVSIDSTVYGTRAYAKKVGDSTYARVIAQNYVTQAGARSAISLTTTGTSGAATYNSTTGVLNVPQYAGTTYSAGTELYLSGTTFHVDTTLGATRLYAQKVGDSTYARAIATAASTYVPLTRTVTPNAPLFGGGALSGNITVSLDTTIAATRAYAQKVRDSLNALVVHIAGTETITGDKTFSGQAYIPNLNGGTAANDDITIQGTTNATRTTSYVNLQPNGGFVGIGITNPFFGLDMALELRLRGLNMLRFGGSASLSDWTCAMGDSTNTGDFRIGAKTMRLSNFGYSPRIDWLVGAATGQVGINVPTPTAWLQVRAGTAAASTAPFKFTSGTNLTTAEAGALEYDGTQLYETNSTAVRGTVEVTRNLTSSAATLTVTNTYSHYTFNGTISTWTLPAVTGNTNFLMRIKNIGSGTLTINSNAGGNDLYSVAAVSTISLAPGDAVVLVNNGTYYLVE